MTRLNTGFFTGDEALTLFRKFVKEEIPNLYRTPIDDDDYEDAFGDLRVIDFMARCIYVGAAPRSWTDRFPSVHEFLKHQSSIVATVTEPALLQTHWTPETAKEGLNILEGMNPSPDEVLASLKKTIDVRLNYLSAHFWHVLANVAGFTLSEDKLLTPTGQLIQLTPDPSGLCEAGWVDDCEALQRELSAITKAKVRVLPATHRTMQLIAYLLANFDFKRKGSGYEANSRLNSGTKTIFDSLAGYRAGVKKNLPVWIKENPLPPSLGGVLQLPVYIHLLVDYAIVNDSAWMPSEKDCGKWALGRLDTEFTDAFKEWKDITDLSSLVAAVGSKTDPVGNLKRVITGLEERRNIHNGNVALNNAYYGTDVGFDGIRARGTANFDIALGLLETIDVAGVAAQVDLMEDKRSDGSRFQFGVHFYGLEDTTWIRALEKVLPDVKPLVYSTNGAKGTILWDISSGYTPHEMTTLIIDNSYGEGSNVADGNSKKFAAIRTASADLLLVRYTLDKTNPFGKRMTAGAVEYTLPYNIKDLCGQFHQVTAWAPGRAHTPEIWVLYQGRGTPDGMGANRNRAKVFDVISKKLFLMDIARRVRQASWNAGAIGAIGPRVFDYIPEEVFSAIQRGTGFGCINRYGSLEASQLFSVLAQTEKESGLSLSFDASQDDQAVIAGKGPAAFSADKQKQSLAKAFKGIELDDAKKFHERASTPPPAGESKRQRHHSPAHSGAGRDRQATPDRRRDDRERSKDRDRERRAAKRNRSPDDDPTRGGKEKETDRQTRRR
jgi:hypothetical protein